MLGTNRQFDLMGQVNSTFDDLAKAMLNARAALDRVEWLKNKLLIEVEECRQAAQTLKIYTEAEAAALLKTDETHLADLRRRLELPHFKLGGKVRYTPEHVREITQIFEHRKQKRGRDLKRAA